MSTLQDHPWRILCIDDDEEDYMILRDMLAVARRKNTRVDWAGTYQEGKARLAETLYDAVFVDYDLGTLTGIELIREVSPTYPAPLILYTGRGSWEVDLEAMEAGATLYLVKNEANPLMLERSLRYALDHKRVQKELVRNLEQKSTILESIQDGLFGLDREWCIIYINSRAAENSGFEPEELVGANIWEVFPRLRGTVLEEQYHRAMDERIPLSFEMQGTYQSKWYHISVYPSADGISVYWQDVTERKKAEEELRQLSRAVEQSPASVVITDLTGQIEYVNPKFTRLTGYSLEEARGKNPSILKTGQTPPEVYRDMWKTILAGRAWEGELVNRKKNGEIYWEYASISPILNDQGKITHFVAVKEDITERKRADQALREAHEYATWMARFPSENPNPVVRVSMEGKILYANPVAREAEGWNLAPDQALPEPFLSLLKQAETSGGELHEDTQINGRFYSVSILFFSNEGYANLYGRDITARHEAEAALRESEERFNKAFEASPNPIVISHQEDGLMQTVNNAFLKLFGYRREEVIGRRSTDLHMFVRTEDRERIVALLRADGELKDFETEIVTRSGEIRHVSLSSALITVNGQANMVTVIVDMTERKQAEEALRSSVVREKVRTAELETLMDTVPAMIWISRDPLCRTMTGNRYGYEALQMWEGANISKSAPDGAVEQQPYRNFKDGREIPTEELPMQVAAAKGEPASNYEMDLVFQDGSVRTVLGNVAPLFDEHGQPSGAVAAFMDISERREIEEQLKRYADELERANQTLRDFTSIASHDLKEPLRKIQTFGGMLNDQYADQLGEKGNDYLARMTLSAGRMSAMIDSLLSYSRVTSHAAPFESVDLSAVARNVLSDLEGRLLQSGGRVDVCDLPTIEADPLQMEQLLLNLIGNALKYHRPDEAPVVEITCRMQDEGMLEMRVGDNGIGFQPERAVRLFEPFVRLHSRKDYEGTGMGLAICKKIVERHGGSISVESQVGVGSTFVVRLPLRH